MLFFVDESGIDLHQAPYSVLAAVSFEESTAWDFAREFSELKRRILRFADPDEYDAKGSKLLKRRVFEQASSEPAISTTARDATVDVLLHKNSRGELATPYELAALAQAKLEFVKQVLDLAKDSGVTTFASIVPRDAQQQYSKRDDASYLRKDWAYLFQRVHCHVCDSGDDSHGILLFDELDPALSQRLLSQIRQYFVETGRGRDRARRILPLPFFVHSHLTPQVQLADLVAYIVNWGLRMPRMREPAREELVPFADRVFDMRYAGHERQGWNARRGRPTWGFAYIPDLRSRTQRDAEDLDAADVTRPQKKGVPPGGGKPFAGKAS